MSAALHLAKPEDLDRLLPLVAAFHAEEGITQDDTTRRNALLPLLEGSPLGAIYIIGPTRAPVGYIVLTFGWSVEFGGMDAFVDELFIRSAVRGRGMGSETLLTLSKMLGQAGVRALHLEVDRENETAKRLYARTGFKARDRYMLMTREL
ncbi:GNAT family N-acetyltransferase [Shimia sp. CNT1-13L.2]|uniref:GNAT family N-acetyltransferase n=1 Tax=Shimia sp. CNT1-13L.2 TaxID=2959663 RepID=UPI0020CF8199|nr:GNAT family N-acetyltransferase [Shimia sp. CNT1-13L.2]MCP9483041.1 GNAT family N-acetyltransferase [Shimia sp. CNT1-13L.2]